MRAPARGRAPTAATRSRARRRTGCRRPHPAWRPGTRRCPHGRSGVGGRRARRRRPATRRGRPRPGEIFRDVGELWCPELVVIPSGSFTMGSPDTEEDRDADEGPQREVTFAHAFAMGRYTVTRGQFASSWRRRAAMSGGSHAWTGKKWELMADRDWQRPGFEQTARIPRSAQLGGRQGLCGVAVAEDRQDLSPADRGRVGVCGARGDGDAVLDGGDDLDRQANYDGNFTYGGGSRASIVKARWRWTISLPAKSVRASTRCTAMSGSGCRTATRTAIAGAPMDGICLDAGMIAGRVLRGGSWISSPEYLRSAGRGKFAPGDRGVSAGFRVARMLTP